MGYSPRGPQESDTTERLNHHRLPELLWEACAAVPGVLNVAGEALEIIHLLP